MNKALLLLLTIVSLSQAIENWNDIKPHSYGVNNITINILPGSQTLKLDTDNQGSADTPLMSGFGIGIHSKASLKQYHYKQAEFFWAGGVDLNIISQSILNTLDSNSLQDMNFNLEFGFSSHIENLIFSTSIGGKWNYLTYTNPVISTIEQETTNLQGIIGYGEVALGYNFKPWTVGGIYNLGIGNYEKGYLGYSKDINLIIQKVSIPFQKNVDKNTAFIITPSYSISTNKDRSFTFREAKIIISFSWLYGF